MRFKKKNNLNDIVPKKPLNDIVPKNCKDMPFLNYLTATIDDIPNAPYSLVV